VKKDGDDESTVAIIVIVMILVLAIVVGLVVTLIVIKDKKKAQLEMERSESRKKQYQAESLPTDRPLNSARGDGAVDNRDVQGGANMQKDLELIPASSKAWTPAQEIQDRRTHHTLPQAEQTQASP